MRDSASSGLYWNKRRVSMLVPITHTHTVAIHRALIQISETAEATMRVSRCVINREQQQRRRFCVVVVSALDGDPRRVLGPESHVGKLMEKFTSIAF